MNSVKNTGPIRGIGSYTGGVVQAVIGGIIAVSSAASLLSGAFTWYRDSGGNLFFLLMTWLGFWIMRRGMRKCALYNLASVTMTALNGGDRESLDVLKEMSKRDYTSLVRDLRELSRRRVFPGAYVDLNRRLFVARPDGALQPPIPQDVPVLREVAKKSNRPIYLVALTWIIYVLVFPLYGITDVIIVAGISVGVYLISRRRSPVRMVIEEVAVEKPKPPKPQPKGEKFNTGNEELDEILTASSGYMAQLRGLESSLRASRVAASLSQLIHTCTQIFEYIKKTPSKIRQIRQFMNYYLPTTIGLVQNYEELYRQPVKGENISTSMTRIEDALVVIEKAFAKELDNLYGDKAMDISVDIEVLQNMLEQEGLTGSGMRAEAQG